MPICLDPGHSGPYEPGAVFAQYTEAAIALAIAKHLADRLHACGCQTLMTRTGNIQTDGLAFRAELANANACRAFVSIHANAFGQSGPRGVETYFFPGSRAGAGLALAIQDELTGLAYTIDRGIKPARFAVLRDTVMPAVLVETGFITNAADRACLVTPAWQGRIAGAIAAGVLAWLAGTD